MLWELFLVSVKISDHFLLWYVFKTPQSNFHLHHDFCLGKGSIIYAVRWYKAYFCHYGQPCPCSSILLPVQWPALRRPGRMKKVVKGWSGSSSKLPTQRHTASDSVDCLSKDSCPLKRKTCTFNSCITYICVGGREIKDHRGTNEDWSRETETEEKGRKTS